MFLLGNEGSFGGLTVSNGCDASWAYIDLHWPETPVGQSGKFKNGCKEKKNSSATILPLFLYSLY